MDVTIEPGWKSVLSSEFEKDYFKHLAEFVRAEYKSQTVYPPGKEIFNAFWECPWEKVRVVIIGQDPYHGPGQANGLCFSVREGVKIPPSLLNIFKEIQRDLGQEMPPHGNLERWAQQGVLLLNATLTVRKQQPGSHQGRGWEEFTNAVIQLLSERKKNLVFLLWGSYAQQKGVIIERSKHLVLESPHPSPFSAHRGFLGNGHFSHCNSYMESLGLPNIQW